MRNAARRGKIFSVMDTMDFLFSRVLSSWQATGSPAAVVLALSGGADSTALLHALHRLSREQKSAFRFCVVHVHHGLRANADADAAFCTDLCDRLRVPLTVVRLRLQGASEDEARSARYQALAQVCAQKRIETVALAHHEKDQAETLLMRLMRGAVAGLGCMREMQRTHISPAGSLRLWRPFLGVDPACLRSALKEHGLLWQEDESNRDPRYLRNFIRLSLLPPMEAKAPGCTSRMAQTAAALAEQQDFLRMQAEKLLDGCACTVPPCFFIEWAPFRDAHPAVRKTALQAFARRCCMINGLTYEQTVAADALPSGKTLNLPGGWRALRTASRLHLVPPVAAEGVLPVLTLLPLTGDPGDGKRTQSMPRALYDRCVLRFGQPGDFIRPFGMQGRKSMQDYWTDHKLDRPFRPYMPLLCMGSEVIWVIGVGASERVRSSASGGGRVLLRCDSRLPCDLPPAVR